MGIMFFGMVIMVAVVTLPQLLDVVWCSVVQYRCSCSCRCSCGCIVYSVGVVVAVVAVVVVVVVMM
jgi:hypothetical protein